MAPRHNPLASDLNDILSRTEAEWAALRGSRIFLTGGTGFIGSWLLESLAWANDRLDAQVDVTVLTRSPGAFARKAPHLMQNPAFRFKTGDVRDFAYAGEQYTHVIHAATAASAQLNTEQPFEMIDTIVDGTRHVLDFTVACKARCFLHTSSGGVYGRQPPTLPTVPEDYAGAPDPMDPWSCYSEGKRMAELLGMLYSRRHGFEHKIARITALVGPHLPLDIHYAMGNFIRDAMRGGPIRIGGDGTPYRSYLYIADLITWLWVILVRGVSNRPYNAGSEEAISILDTARAVNTVCGGGCDIQVAQTPVSGAPAARYVPSTRRAQVELGLRQWTDLPTGIRRTVDWQRSVRPR